jgi:Skp family chaperone for outer membrane proteins
MLITSLGIYGFLSGAYQATADKLGIMDQQTQVIELKKKRFQDELNLSLQERDRLSTNIQELSRGMANNQQQYRDAQTGQILNTTSAANRTALQKQITSATTERTQLAQRIESLSDSIGALDVQVLNINANNDLAAEIGPLKFISSLTGLSMDKVVNIFALMIVFVFDPLAVALVIAVNFLLKQNEEEPTINLEKAEIFNEEPFKVYTHDVVEEQPSQVEEIKQGLTQSDVESMMETWWRRRNGMG